MVNWGLWTMPSVEYIGSYFSLLSYAYNYNTVCMWHVTRGKQWFLCLLKLSVDISGNRLLLNPCLLPIFIQKVEMATSQKLIEKLDQDLLECGICLDRYKQPRGQPCLHSFCHECLVTICTGTKRILCPICQKPVVVPEEGVSGFPAHFMANTLQETLDLEKLKVGLMYGRY